MKKIKLSAGRYSYRGLTLSKLPRDTGYYGGTAFQDDKWIIEETKGRFDRSCRTLNALCEDIDEWLDDDFWAKGHPVRDAASASKL